MGAPMAAQLLQSGYPVTVFNRSPEKAAPLIDAGASLAPSIAELAAESEIITTMVADDPALADITSGADGVFAHAKSGSTLVDMSTVSPTLSVRISAEAAAAGVAYLRAPVNGTVMQAEQGILVILTSGPKEVYDAVHPMLDIMGGKIFYTGEAEQARYLKLCINMMVGITSAMMGEALVLGEAGGLDWDQMIEIIKNSAVGAPVIHYKEQTLKNRDFTAAFSARQMAKDFDLMLAASADGNVPLPLTTMVRRMWSDMIDNDMGERDFFAYVELLEIQAGLKK